MSGIQQFGEDEILQASGGQSNIHGSDLDTSLVQVYYSGGASYPTANNDGVDTAGLGEKFFKGSIWVNETTGHRWQCDSIATGAAVWRLTTPIPASRAEMEAGTEVALRSVSPFRVAQAIAALSGAGSVLQVASVLTTAQGAQIIAANTDTVISGLAINVVPKGANSRFFITARQFGECIYSWNNVYNILMNGTRVNIGGSTAPYAGLSMPTKTYDKFDDNNSTPEILTLQTIVSTASVVGAPINFALAITTDTAKRLYLNRCVGAPAALKEVGSSEITVMEIGA